MPRVCEHGRLVGVRLLRARTPRSHPRRPAGAAHTDSQPQYSSRSPRTAPTWVSVSAASIVVALSGALRLGGLRSRACRCSRGRRPSGCDTEARGRRATLPQRHQRGVGGLLTRTPLRRAYRLQRPCSLRSFVVTLGARSLGRPSPLRPPLRACSATRRRCSPLYRFRLRSPRRSWGRR